HRSEAMRRAINGAGMVTPDGMPLVWLLRRAGFKQCTRVYGPDLMLAVFAQGQRLGYKHFLYGTTEHKLSLLEQALRRRFPLTQIIGSAAPPFRPLSPTEDDAYVARLNGTSPDIVWVGLSTPKQEYWMAEHRNRLTAPVLIGVGAAFDIHAG